MMGLQKLITKYGAVAQALKNKGNFSAANQVSFPSESENC